MDTILSCRVMNRSVYALSVLAIMIILGTKLADQRATGCLIDWRKDPLPETSKTQQPLSHGHGLEIYK